MLDREKWLANKMLSSSQFQHCGALNDSQLKILNLTMSISGGVGTLVTLLILGGLIYAKAYKTPLQRLFMYSVLATMVHEILHVIQIEEQFQYEHQDQVCMHLGFLSNWSGWIIYVFNLSIILYLVIVVYQQLRGGYCCKYSPLCKGLTECVYVLGSILFPVGIIWVPYKEHEYGLNEAYCYIRAFDNNCTDIGIKDKLIYAYSFYEGVGILAILIAISITIVYWTLSVILRDAKRLLKQILILVLAVILYIIILNTMLVVDILVDTSYSLNIFFAISATLTDLIFLFGYLLAFYSSGLRRKLVECKRQRQHHYFDAEDDHGKEYGTFEDSSRITRPSFTYYDVPYTGEFTSVSN